MVDVLTLELNTQQMVAEAQRTNVLLEQLVANTTRAAQSTDRLGTSLQTGSRNLSSFTINSLQAVNNVSNLTRGIASMVNGTTTLAAGLGSAGVEVGLLAGNFIHLYFAAQQAGGPGGIAGLWQVLKANPFVLITAGIIAAAQAFAIFGSNAKQAKDEVQFLSSLGNAGAAPSRFKRLGALEDIGELLSKQSLQHNVLGPLGAGSAVPAYSISRLLGFGDKGGDNSALGDYVTKLGIKYTQLPAANRSTDPSSELLTPAGLSGGQGLKLADVQRIVASMIRTESVRGSFGRIERLDQDDSYALLDPRARARALGIRDYTDRYGSEEAASANIGSRIDFRQRAQEMRDLSDDLSKSLTGLLSVESWGNWQQAGIQAIKGIVNSLNEAFIQKPITQALSNVFASVFSPAPTGGIR